MKLCHLIRFWIMVLAFSCFFYSVIHSETIFHESTLFPDEPLTRIYERAVSDLKEGKPLIVTSYLAACPAHIFGNGTLGNNLYWDFMYGHKTMFDRSHRDDRIRRISPNTVWERVFYESRESEPQRIAVYKSKIVPNDKWSSAGINDSFTLYHIYLYYLDDVTAFSDLTANTKMGIATLDSVLTSIVVEDRVINIGKDSHFTGFWGHNLFYDYRCIGLGNIDERNPIPEGIFAVGCHTNRVGSIPQKIIGGKDVGFLFTYSFMAPEGYVAIGLLEAISQAQSNAEIIDTCNRAYQYFQMINGPRPGPLFEAYNE